MKDHPVLRYLVDCRARHSTCAKTPETSLYAPLETLLTTVGTAIKPKVRAFMSLKNQGGNMPDGGLFTREQYDKHDSTAIEPRSRCPTPSQLRGERNS